MKKSDAEHFRQQLLALRKELEQLAVTGDEAAATVELDQSRVGRLSRMDAMQGQAMSMEVRNRRRRKLTQIDAALTRIENDDFGYCDSCLEPIALARLQFDPAARLCIDCATRAEDR